MTLLTRTRSNTIKQLFLSSNGANGHFIQHCTNNHLVRQGKQVHARIILHSVIPDDFLGSKLLTFYATSGFLFEARHVFDNIPNKNVFSWNAMLIAYSHHGRNTQTLELFSSLVSLTDVNLRPNSFTISSVLKALSSPMFHDRRLVKEVHGFVCRHGYESDLFVVNGLITCYARLGELSLARKLFDQMQERDIVSWNSIISGYSQCGFYEDCLILFKEMECLGLRFDGVTVVSVLQACTQLKDLDLGRKVHQLVLDNRIEVDTAVSNSIIGLYAKCGSLEYARKLFNEMTEKDGITYGSMISGYMNHGFVDEALELFREMKNPGLSTWNSLISGLVQNSHHDSMREFLHEMQAMGCKPDSVTLSSVLPTISYFSNLKSGKEIHCYAIRNGYDGCMYVTTGLIDTYARSGFINGAYEVFKKSSLRNVIVWTAMISAYAAHGDAVAAISLFADMLGIGIKPDRVTFTAVLTGCAHSGIVSEARKIFDSMLPYYGVVPEIEHYACMVAVLSRAGMIYEAADFISRMPIEPSAKVWGALLNGISVSGDVNLGRFICEKLFEIEPQNTWNYVVLANLYVRAGMWDDAVMVRGRMKKMGLKKLPGCSWIETDNGLQTFVARDVSSERIADIYDVLGGLIELMREEGYVSITELDEEML
ncbi:hypothetical protein C5167_046635 [Papaver somniferum]|uniref:Pentacotripeptide-repeat region of PRORP domain-containing protein n=1 Tax=Papaver somniferum TaxID=3469 RepID=A0A4Y7LED1_PAPSO|nr:pentatricopeptide repeat-containing protein At2g37310-like [Papaver somniferum]XP_026425737.1 pentatricopeptide repeat-containing protein At2g37310-like [Papaver somniferum]RZC83854.1 hypothetical protein C5167_046635 [Papaver somniferum]